MEELKALGGIFFILVVLFGVLVAAVIQSSNECDRKQKALVAECLSSGKQNFECQAMFAAYCRSSSTVVPMVIPMPVGR